MLETKSRDGNNTVAGEARADGGLQRRQQQMPKIADDAFGARQMLKVGRGMDDIAQPLLAST